MRYWINALLLLALASTSLSTYFIKYKTRQLELELRKTRKMIHQREEEITVLRGELSYRSRPERLERLARQFLDLQPVRPEQVIVPEMLPRAVRSAVQAGGSVSASESESGTGNTVAAGDRIEELLKKLR